MVNLTRIISQEDIDSLNPGDAVEFSPDVSRDKYGLTSYALVGEMGDYGSMPVYHLTEQDRICEFRINRNDLLPGPNGTLGIKPRVTIVGPIEQEEIDDELRRNIIAGMSLKGFFEQ